MLQKHLQQQWRLSYRDEHKARWQKFQHDNTVSTDIQAQPQFPLKMKGFSEIIQAIKSTQKPWVTCWVTIHLIPRICMQAAYPEINLLPQKVLLNLEEWLITAPAASLAAPYASFSKINAKSSKIIYISN